MCQFTKHRTWLAYYSEQHSYKWYVVHSTFSIIHCQYLHTDTHTRRQQLFCMHNTDIHIYAIQHLQRSHGHSRCKFNKKYQYALCSNTSDKSENILQQRTNEPPLRTRVERVEPQQMCRSALKSLSK